MSNSDRQMSSVATPVAAVQSVDRALSVLELLAARGEMGVTEVAGELGVHKSTAFRLLAVLERHELVEQVGNRGAYRLGLGIVRLAGVTTARLDLAEESRRACEQLSARLGETANVAIRDEAGAINVSQVRGGSAIASHNWVGQRTPLHATSSGKVLLAYAPEQAQAAVFGRTLPRFTEATITDAGQLALALEEVRRRGWACTVEELEANLTAVAAPVRGQDGRVVAALSVSGPSYRLMPESIEDVAAAVTAAAAEMSRRLGYVAK